MVSSIDVAKLAGVSQATVSRVLNDPDKVNKPTLDKVNAAIRQLNYRPNAAARSLISRKSGVIAIVSGPLDNPDNAEFTNETIKRIQERGFIAEIHLQDSSNPESVLLSVQNTQAEGIILGSVVIDEIAIAKLKKTGIPLMFFNMEPAANELTASLDNRSAGAAAAEYINSLSHSNVGWLGGEPSESHLQLRYQGFQECAKANNMNILRAMAAIDDLDAPLSAMLARKERPTAIITATDMIAYRAMDFLVDYGYRIPDDISLLGIGNAPLSAMSYMNLSSIGISGDRDIYSDGVDRLVKAIEEGGANKSVEMKYAPVLFERKSTRKI